MNVTAKTRTFNEVAQEYRPYHTLPAAQGWDRGITTEYSFDLFAS
jgi:hypothetical protein